FEFSPISNNLVYVAGKSGQIRVFDIFTGEDKGIFIDLSSEVNNYNDRGLMDISLHPNFPQQPYIYVFYVVDPLDAASEGLLDKPGNRYAQLVRFTADIEADFLRVVPESGVVVVGSAGRSLSDINGNGRLDFASPAYASLPSSERYLDPASTAPTLVVEGIKQDYIKVDAMSHAGGSLAFGPDGYLYVSIGDGSSPTYADPHAGDVQNLDSLSGKILRIDPITGHGLASNPFFEEGQSLDSNRSKIYQYGLRNPFSMAFDQLGQLFISDTGWNAYEEINVGFAGANFGWPWFEGREGGSLSQTSGYRSFPEAIEFYEGVNNGTTLVIPPYAAFGHAASAPGYQNQAITGGSFVYSGGIYPSEFQDDYFFTNFTNGNVFTIDTKNRQNVQYLYTSQSSFAPVHFEQGPDGYVYYIDLGDYNPNSSNGVIGRLKILSKDGPTVTATVSPAASVEGAELGPTITFTLSTVQSDPVTITYSTTGSSASAGLDFIPVVKKSLVISPGQIRVSDHIELLLDAIIEPREIFTIVIDEAVINGRPMITGEPVAVAIEDSSATRLKPIGAIASTYLSEVLTGTSGRDVFYFDTALGLGLGNDTIRGFAAGDRLVTTTRLYDANEDRRVTANG
ncbi:PQQ-dependent sugar dehydrogenase, partial [Methylobacterium iners]